MRYVLPLLLLTAWLLSWAAQERAAVRTVQTALPAVSSDRWTNRYDGHFRKWSKRYFGPHFDWRWFKAQAIVESGLRPGVKGPTGSKGVMQVQPLTYREIKGDNPHLLDINDPHSNIAAGIYYDRQMYDKWPNRAPLENRICFMLGSYNVGYGGVQKAVERAQRSGMSGRQWYEIVRYLPDITRDYVATIGEVMTGPREPQAQAEASGGGVEVDGRADASP